MQPAHVHTSASLVTRLESGASLGDGRMRPADSLSG